MPIRVLVALPLVLLLGGCAGLSAGVPKSTPVASNLALGGPFTCADRTGGLSGKGFASLPQVKSLRVDRQDGLDRLIFEFTAGPNGPDAVPFYSISQRLEPQFVKNDPQQTVTLRGSAGIDLDFGAVAATHGYWKFQAMPSRMLHTLGAVDYATDLSTVREVTLLGYFGPASSSVTPGVSSPAHWGIGLASGACFRVTELSHPARLVIDFDTAHPAPTPGPFRLTQIMDATFVDASHGWLLGAGCATGMQECRLTVQQTADGGQHWMASPAPDLPAYPVEGTSRWHLRFGTPQDGWIYGPQLYATHDGGKTWTLARASSVVSLVSVGQSVWALEGSCSNGCSLSLLRSADAGRSWSSVNVPQLDHAGFAVTARVDDNHGWILAWGIETQPAGTLLRTSDGGVSWQALRAPCTPSLGESGAMGAASASNVWVVCGGMPGAGQQLKQLGRSVDGGAEWTISDLSSSGYVADLAVTSASRAWLAFGRGPLSITVDGGHTWRTSIENNDAGIAFVRFVDPLHGWAATAQQLYRTTDGGVHWPSALAAVAG
ncbi:MAG: hypothetical protein M3Z28_13425 [Candidatus Dormibacteraeota bacterium]|nr:hypothetical protein [Candidatus Dormibacteraeota bacterium]